MCQQYLLVSDTLMLLSVHRSPHSVSFDHQYPLTNQINWKAIDSANVFAMTATSVAADWRGVDMAVK